MGSFVQRDGETVYQQADGEVTAWLIGFEEKMVLEHKGTRRYRIVLYFCVALGLVYLSALYLML